MNKVRRKQLEKAMELIQEAQEIIESMKDEEQEAFDNILTIFGLQYWQECLS